MSIKKYFIPHKSNRFHPHFFRNSSVVFMALTLSGSFLLFSAALRALPKSDSYAAIFVGALITYTNEARVQEGDNTLTTNNLLTQAAQLKANDMAKKGYFAHNTPDGKTPWYWFDKVGYKYQYAGENLAIDFVDSKDVTDAWMASPKHRANMLNPNLKEIGIATAVGMYEGRETTFIVQMFGSPASSVWPRKISSAVAPPLAGQQVAGAQTETISAVERAIASPKKSVVDLYSLFIGGVVTLLFLAALFEFKRHHKGIWLSGGALIVTTAVLVVLTLQLGQGLV